MIKADLHIHTCYSPDCCTPLEKIVDHCLNAGINCLAVADHNTIEGALKLQKIAPFKIIVAEEIMTSEGELIGLFLTEEIPRGLSPEETIARIKSQGGLVNIPHPFGRWPLYNPKKLKTPEILSQLDIIEVFNSRTPTPHSSTKAWQLARKFELPASAGSDAHTLGEIGRAYVEMPQFNATDDFLHSLAQGRIVGRMSNPFTHLASVWIKIRKGSC